MRLFLGLFLAMMATQVGADDKFVYDAQGKRDPFLPLVSSGGAAISYDTDITASDMSLEGIVADPKGDNVAIINGKMVKANDMVGSYLVEHIAVDHVNLVKGEEKSMLKLKKGGM